MKLRAWIILILLSLWLAACGSPFAPVVLAPSTVEAIDSPDELPDALISQSISWYGNLIGLDSTIIALPENAKGFIRFSGDVTLITYSEAPIVVGKNGLPYVADSYIVIYDLTEQNEHKLVSKEVAFPDAVAMDMPTFTPDGKSIMFWVGWEHETDLAVVDIETGAVRRLHVDVTVTNFGMPDVSTDGHIVVICRGPEQQRPSSELCLLDNNGKFIRYLTAEGYPWPGYGRFTPDGQYVVYESRYRLYKVRIDGQERQQIAPCSALFGPLLVTEDYAVTACYISQEPDCYALFIASLDGRDFRRIGYIEPYCVSGE